MTTEGRLLGDRYRLSQPIGRGRGGFIWLAEDQHVHRTVAAKPVALPRGTTDGELEVAVRRARDASRLKHQCAVAVYDVLVEADGIWLITEYVPSRTMADFLAGHGKLTAHDTVTLGAQLAAALTAAAELGLTHRAVEPANVLLADDGGVQITDFGVGALHHDPAFRAPEVIAGGAATSASDVFSLGATLYYAVHGVTPFGPLGTDAGPETRTTEPGGQQNAEPSASGGQDHAARLLPRVIEQTLSMDPAQRPSMAGCWEALAAIAEGRQPKPMRRQQPAPPQQIAPQPAQTTQQVAPEPAEQTTQFVPQQSARHPAQQATPGAESPAAAPSAATRTHPPATSNAGAQPHATAPLPVRQQPPAPHAAAAGWQQPMPPSLANPVHQAGPHAGSHAGPMPQHNRAALRALLVVAVLLAAMLGIVFTEIVLV